MLMVMCSSIPTQEILVVLFVIIHVIFCMVSLEKLVDLAFFMQRFWVYTMV
ncbi:transmembrane protein, putative [Medicago truncatula]|uniref:Transmembrane protein, putative n=1 Tax=Medicago truncatula TaxID=3880 RepID=A0A072UBF5_MEDTR|nr:transmembrane protein, putative [Medicago truncatula]